MDPVVGAALIGGAASFFGGSAQRKHAAGASRRAYLRQRQLMQDAPSLQAKGLEKAGLNRIMAVGGQPSAPNVAQEAPPQNITGDAVSAAMQSAQLANVQAQAKKTAAEAEVIEAEVPIKQKIEEVTREALSNTAKKVKLFGKKYKQVMQKAIKYEKKRSKNKKPPEPVKSRFKSLHKTW